jgi:hypothetical protein
MDRRTPEGEALEMKRPVTPLLRAFALVGLLTVAAFASADADDVAPKPAPSGHVYDVRVVRVDASATAIEAAPAWASAPEATAAEPWADLLRALKERGRTTVLCDQRLTSEDGRPGKFDQQRKRLVESLQSRTSTGMEAWVGSYVETGTSGEMTPYEGRLSYRIEVTWEVPTADREAGTVGRLRWEGSCAQPPSGRTLVLSHRQQPGPDQAGTEIYVFLSAATVPAT